MRINIYSQEVTPEVELVEKEGDGRVYRAVRLFLHSSDKLHHTPEDDDRSAVTFWMPRTLERRTHLAMAFIKMAHILLTAPPEKEEYGKGIVNSDTGKPITRFDMMMAAATALKQNERWNKNPRAVEGFSQLMGLVFGEGNEPPNKE